MGGVVGTSGAVIHAHRLPVSAQRQGRGRLVLGAAQSVSFHSRLQGIAAPISLQT